MIIFKLISIGIEQNLRLGCLKFYFRGKKKLKILYIIFCFWPSHGVHLNPMGYQLQGRLFGFLAIACIGALRQQDVVVNLYMYDLSEVEKSFYAVGFIKTRHVIEIKIQTDNTILVETLHICVNGQNSIRTMTKMVM